MKSKHKTYSRTFILLSIVSLFFLSGCVQSPEIKQFSQDLPQYDENLEIILGNIHTDFYNYDLDYSVNRLMNLLTITDSMVTGMKKEENNIKEDMLNFEEIAKEYQTAKSSININMLSEEDKLIVNKIDNKISEYNLNKEKVNSCLSKMEEYRDWIKLVNDNAKILEKFETQSILMNEYVQSEKYQDALSKVTEIQNTISQMKDNAQKRKDSGIQTFSTETIQSYDALSNSYNTYKEYINLLIDEDWEEAEIKYIEYSQEYSEAISMGSDEDASITEAINEADTWYQENIGVCFDLFESYS
ncbi:MAG: hypothetical protein PWQ87_201 [Candidatus Woesearchaeota archaeon]|nr:hypothetical protein [Candidatus Woesearchaeota archaeon]